MCVCVCVKGGEGEKGGEEGEKERKKERGFSSEPVPLLLANNDK